VLTYWVVDGEPGVVPCVWLAGEGRACVAWRGAFAWTDALAPAEAIRKICCR
jgi:hypothetical protein